MTTDKYSLVEQDYDAVDTFFHNSYNTIKEYKEQVESFLVRSSGNRLLLNIGGTLAECSHFADRSWNVTNIDLSQAMLDYIKVRDDRIDLEKTSIVGYEHMPFDAIWACRSLVHIPPEDINESLRNIKRLLNPGGTLGAIFFTTIDDYKEEFLDEPHTDKQGIVYYRVLYSTDYLRAAFEKQGFNVLKEDLCSDQDNEQSVYFELS